MKKSINILAVILTMSLIYVGCENQVTKPNKSADVSYKGKALNNSAQLLGDEASITDIMSSINDKMASENLNYRVLMAEYITADESGEIGNTVLAKDVGNKQLGADFVPNDTRRTWSGPATAGSDNITYVIDQTLDAVPFSPGLTAVQTTEAIDNAMTTWDNQTCSDLAITRNPDLADDLGFIAAINGLGGSFTVGGDIQHAGFRDIDFGGGVLGVAFTLIFTDAGVPTDIDNNGKIDVAFREIYYDPSWFWGTDGSANFVDVESIALHEAGHGLSQAHFGKVMIKNNGDLKASPRAVMNALYAGPLRELRGTDNGGHCSNWGQWPNN